MNTLYYGDNLNILREHISTGSVDLVYLDPPFNSNRTYNVLFKDESGNEAEAQITAFEDTWHWNQTTEATYGDLVTHGEVHISRMISSLTDFIGKNQMMAYLVMMAVRLVELHRILKETGSLYLHCDPAASHYLKLILDTIFGFSNFRNEIVWRRTNAHNKTSKQFGPIHDVILFYTKTSNPVFHPETRPYTKAYIEDVFTNSDEKGRFRMNMLTGAGTRTGDSGKEWRGFDPTKVGRHWAIPASLIGLLPSNANEMNTQQKLEAIYEQGMIVFPKKPGGQPTYKQYVGRGVPHQDIWAYQPGTAGILEGSPGGIDEDVKWLDADEEKLGYPTQKPVGLLERIINASSNPNDVVLDPFCGCGTTIAAAQKLRRQWVGIDITHLSIALQKYRLKDSFGLVGKKDYTVIGEPEDLPSAYQLKEDDPYQFQWWALSLIKARPLGGVSGSKQGKKGKDRGIDGVISFIDEPGGGRPKQVLVQVKSGKVKSGDIRDLRGTIEREQAAIGVFITLEAASRDMIAEAVGAGFYHSPGWNRDYPKLQILTIAELLDGKELKMPPATITFKSSEKIETNNKGEQVSLF